MKGLHRPICLSFVVAAAAVYLVAGSPPGTRGARYIVLHFVLTALMLAAWAVPARASDHRATLIAGVLARLLLIGVPAFTSHDAARYLWDGHAVLVGVDPYRDAPDVARHSTGAWPLPPNHTSYPTLYPPGALGLFAAASAAGPSRAFWIWKSIVAAASCAALGLAWRLLKERSLERRFPLVALSPLLVLEGGVGAHVDLVASLAVTAALLFDVRGRLRLAGGSIGAGAVLKILPIALLVPAAASRRRIAVAVGLAVVLVVYAAACLMGLHPIGSLPAFFRQWRFGSPLFELTAGVVGDERARRSMLVAAAGGLALAAARARTEGFVAGAQWALAIPLLTSPVVFPWYLASLVPLLALRPSAAGIAWVSVLPLTYEVIDGFERAGFWQPASWPLWTIGLSWIAGGAIDVARSRREWWRTVEPVASPKPRISVIVPVLDEEARIAAQLGALRDLDGLHEVIVVDGGSTDRTVNIVRAHGAATLIDAPRGRATQMNAGAAVASGDVLLFLHADVRLPRDAVRWIVSALAEPGVIAGAFRTWTVAEGRRSWARPFLHLADVRSRYTSLPYGDQALFVRADVFRRLGGFPEQPLMEDLELSRRLRDVGRIRTVPASVRVSGRRFLARPAYYTLLVNVLPLLYRLGAPPRLLASLYGDPR